MYDVSALRKSDANSKMVCCRRRQSRRLLAATVAAGQYDSQTGRTNQGEGITTLPEASGLVSSKKVDLDPEHKEGRRRWVCLWFGNCIFVCLERGHEHGMTVARPQQKPSSCWGPVLGAEKVGVCRLRPAWLSFYMISVQHANATFIGQLQPCHQSKCSTHISTSCFQERICRLVL